ncbi:MAG: PEP-CTERM sorting domain-containing protein [Armatimonadetes bacterium]|nr:PEP-CTERM sorting domain-containing protein [Armatimonadota bacterium]
MRNAKLYFGALVTLASTSAFAQTVYYGGDWNGGNNLEAQYNYVSESFNSVVYDDFTLTSPNSIDGIFGNFIDDTGTFSSHQLYWEIRSDISAGNGGTLVHAGTISSATVTGTGIFNGNVPINRYESAVDPFVLSAGTYFLGIAVNHPPDQTFLCATSGQNSVGIPFQNGNSFWNAPGLFENFSPTSDLFGHPVDFSMGLKGSAVVPEPTSLVALAFSLSVFARRRAKVSK